VAVVSVAKGQALYSTTMKALKNLLDVGVQIQKTAAIKPNLLATVDTESCITIDSRVYDARAEQEQF